MNDDDKKMAAAIAEKWLEVSKKYKIGQRIMAIVESCEDYGIFLDIGEYPIFGFIRVTGIIDNISKGEKIQDYFPKKDTIINGVIVDMPSYCEIVVSIRPSILEKFGIAPVI
jgi:ribosomal protein S1